MRPTSTGSKSVPPVAPLSRQNSPSQPTATSLSPSPLRSPITGDDVSCPGLPPGCGLTAHMVDPSPRKAYTDGVPLLQAAEQLLSTTSGLPSPFRSPMAGEASVGPFIW